MTKKIEKSAEKVEKWIEDHDYKGYEAFDGLSSYLRPFTFHNLLLDQLLQQLVRQSPINLRPLLGVRPQESTKGRGYITRGYLNKLIISGEHQYREKATNCLEWLIKNTSPGYSYCSWGNHFDYASRGGKISRLEPTIVWTSLIGQTFLDAYETLNDERYLQIAISVCQWILDLPKEKTDTGTCLSYVAKEQSSIHNSNMLGASILARVARLTENSKYLEIAKEAMAYSCSGQLSNGAWHYGQASKYHWIDNFHTGYNLDSLKCYIDNSNDKTFEENLIRGYNFFKKHFFAENGRPKYYHNRAYPIDIQCASQAIDTLTYFSESDKSSLELALKVANWTIDNMQDNTGYFYYRILPFKKVRIPMIHWGQATMYKALTHLMLKLKK